MVSKNIKLKKNQVYNKELISDEDDKLILSDYKFKKKPKI